MRGFWLIVPFPTASCQSSTCSTRYIIKSTNEQISTGDSEMTTNKLHAQICSSSELLSRREYIGP